MIAALLQSVRRCGLCGENFLDEIPCDICSQCWERLPIYSGPVCVVCGKPFPLAGAGKSGLDRVQFHCSDCCTRITYFDGCTYIGLYSGYLKKMIYDLKYRRFADVGACLGRILADSILEKPWRLRRSVIVPVPLHLRKLEERGYNQAEVIARGLSQALSVPLVTTAVIRTKETADQKRLRAADRAKNVLGAFRVAAPHAIACRDVILVDDVMTTGSTLNEAAKTVKSAGAHRVFAAVAATGVGCPCKLHG